jgi:hypothetical protein
MKNMIDNSPKNLMNQRGCWYILLFAVWVSSCTVYIEVDDQVADGNAAVKRDSGYGDANEEEYSGAMDASASDDGVDSSDKADGAGAVESGAPDTSTSDIGIDCVGNPNDDQSCPWICPEVCDGVDNDCDHKTDEIEEACDLSHASSKCEQNQCVIARCAPSFGDCDQEPSNGCETALTTLSDCGKCDVACTGRSCAGGACSDLTCPSGFGDCDMDPDTACETPLNTLTNCAMCGASCSTPNAATSCADGTCKFVKCRAGFADCDGDPTNGCEIALNTLDNCGACGVICTVENGQPSCPGGRCTTSTCGDGYADCNANPTDGCEVSLRSVEHCGSCDERATCGPLEHATATCGAGTCQIEKCSEGYGDCDGEPSNGCETPLNTNHNCGACQKTCGFDNTVTSCETGICQISRCVEGFSDCNTEQSDGCEVDIKAVNTCGSCTIDCRQLPDVSQVACSSGSCSIQSCNAGTADCTADPGCETALGTMNNCASCGNQCPALPNASYPHALASSCSAYACGVSQCEANFSDCNHTLNDGCERDLLNDAANCNGCGNVCGPYAHAAAKCASGACALASCSSGYGDCDGDVANGCEVSLTTTANHCGSCSTVCTNAHGTTSCAAATCVPSCSSGYGDCDGLKTNGCETPLDTTSNCGSCGNICPANGGTAICNAGTCNTICSLTGTYALKVTAPVSWSSLPDIRSGSGTFYSWSMLQVTHSGNTLTGTLVECGRDTPHVQSNVLSEYYKITYPSALFDHSLPNAAATVTLGSSSPGASFTLATATLYMGTSTTTNPSHNWASGYASELTSSDMDGDGKAGVSGIYLNSGNDYYPPTSDWIGYNRADYVYFASRTAFSLSGTLNSCTGSSGSATVSHADTRIFGCNRSSSSSDCDSGEGDFLDSNQPNFGASSATYTLVKMTSTTTCAVVRSTLP